MSMDAPFSRSYWVVPSKFLAGAYPGDWDPDAAERKLRALLDTGVRTFLSLMEEDETDRYGQGFVPYADTVERLASASGVEVAALRFPVMDLDVPGRAAMKSILDAIDRSIGEGKPVYVHCWGGRGRTGTVVGCWLARHGIASGERAIGMIGELRAGVQDASYPSPETVDQRDMVVSWEEGE